jgi:galactose mutarotase-like enzyme
MEQIKNSQLTVEIADHGAELVSVKDAQGKEYLWQADPKYWGRHSPILFPIVGSLWNGVYHVGGKDYPLSRHGFARDMDFHLIAKGDEQVVFALHDSAETLEKYPFHFNLAVSYRLKDNQLHVVWHVENTDDKTIWFQVGGHPAFNVPDMKQGEALHGRLRFDNAEPIRRFLAGQGCLDRARHEEVKTENGVWAFDTHSFDSDALVFDHSQIRKIELLDAEGKAVVTVQTKAPALGIWSPGGKDAPFICIEPWYGVTDVDGFDGELRDKYLVNQLLPGSSFMSEYVITIG